jgi:CubicO group peptidase (beta-lactamase class C family)
MKIRLSRTVFAGVFACLLALLALAYTALPVAAATRSNEPDFAKIDAYVSAQMQAMRLPGLALGIVHGNQIVHLHGFGEADQSGRAVTAQTPFVIGSMTKSFTALAIMQLVEAGKMELDVPVQRYLPWFRVADPTASARISVRNLLNQTSGIPTSAGVAFLTEPPGTLEQQVRDLSKVALTQPVGKTFQYSNSNYATLGLIIETISGQTYGTYIQQHILAPLQMGHSFVTEHDARQGGLAQGYHWLFGYPFPVNEPYRLDMLPAGWLSSTAEDMSHYLIAQMNGGHYGSVSVLSPAGIASMHAPAVVMAPGAMYGMGWVYQSAKDSGAGVPLIWHNGETLSFHADMFIEPQGQWGAVMLTNAAGLSPLPEIALENLRVGIASLLAGQVPPAGLNLSISYLIIDSVLVLVSILVLLSVLRLSHWYQKFGQRRGRRLLRVSLRLIWELVLPVVLLLGLPILFSSWSEFLFVFPDLGPWLIIILSVMIITALIRVVLVFLALRRKDAGTPLVTPSAPSPSSSLT